MHDEPHIAPSARKHGVSDEDILHAYRCAMRSDDEDDGLTMVVGPSRAARLLELGVVRSAAGPVVVHAMSAGRKYLRW
ncbi:hypothetical protein E1269_05055 [Jiangella asiatica]|uniref:Uncharacterized protein n=1 Tax=Jiangella asiatica TaxID=2530372 RepID=A0A4R5DPY8_9ACTN|nr:hypothetical protein E1269_05055 [Jiangella asiatica]